MIKQWQSMQDYKCFLHVSKVSFDSSERNRLHTELWVPWQKLVFFDTDCAMEFLLPFYSPSGRPAKNQPQILRSFILFFLMVSRGLTLPSLSRWVERLSNDRVLAALIGCSLSSLPPLGSYFDFMDRLWIHTDQERYSRRKLLPASLNSRKPDKPKGKHQKAQRNLLKKSPKRSWNGFWTGRISLSTLSPFSSSFFTMSLSSLPSGVVSFPPLTLRFPATALPSIPMPAHSVIIPGSRKVPFPQRSLLLPLAIIRILMPPGVGTATWKNTTMDILFSICPAIMTNSTRMSRSFYALPAPSAMIPSIFSPPSMNWKNICLTFPYKTCVLTLPWTICPPTGC